MEDSFVNSLEVKPSDVLGTDMTYIAIAELKSEIDKDHHFLFLTDYDTDEDNYICNLKFSTTLSSYTVKKLDKDEAISIKSFMPNTIKIMKLAYVEADI